MGQPIEAQALERIIIPVGYGRTCNQILQVAHWIPTAIQLGVPLYFPGFREYAKLFAGTCDTDMPRYPHDAPPLQGAAATLAQLFARVSRTSRRKARACLRLVRMMPGNAVFQRDDDQYVYAINPASIFKQKKVATAKTLWIKGWLYRDYRGMQVHGSDVEEFFSLPPADAERVADFMKKARQGRDIIVGLHLRRGDYRLWQGGKYCYDDEAFRAVMGRMVAALPNRSVRFLLVSNEAIDTNHYAGYDVVPGPGDMQGDLYSLAACDYIVGPPSTYTIWASWYGKAPCYHLTDPTLLPHLDDFKVARG